MAAASKKLEASTPAKQFIPGPGALRSAIVSVRRAVDERGKHLPIVLIKLGASWVEISLDDLIHRRTSSLVSLAVEHSLDASDLEEADLRQLCKEILAATRNRVGVLLREPGYHEVAVGSTRAECFAWNGQLFWVGEKPDIRVICSRHPAPARVGTLKEWKANVGSLFVGQHNMIVALGATLCSLLVRPLGLERLTLTLVGKSSSGKGTIQRACASAIRSGALLDSASGTPIGLHQRLAEYVDQPYFADELQQLGSVEGLFRLIYDMGNQAERVVGTAGQRATVAKPLTCTFIGSDELSFAERCRQERGARFADGVSARVFEIRINEANGAFNDIPESLTAAQFAERVKDRASRFYGALWPKWIRLVAADLPAIRERATRVLPQIRAKLEEIAAVQDQITKRMIHGYAGWYLALVIAADDDLIPITREQIGEAMKATLVKQLKLRESPESQLDIEVLAAVRDSIDRNAAMFVDIEQSTSATRKFWGYMRGMGDELQYLVFPDALTELAPRFEKELIAGALDRSGLLQRNKDGLSLSVRLPRHPVKRFYAISARIRADG